jgi:hypothetical protein
MPARQKRLLGEALIALLMARAAMVFLSFRRIAIWLGTPGAESLAMATVEEIQIAQEVGWAVGAIARRVPWDGRCLAQALAAMGMLRRRGLEGSVSFGASQSDSAEFAAHAWLRLGSCIVTGGASHEHFKIITTFSRRRP